MAQELSDAEVFGTQPMQPVGTNPNAPVQIPPSGAAPPSFSGPSTVRQAEQQQTGSDASARFRDIANAGIKAREQQAVLATMQNDLPKFNPGPGAGWSLLGKKVAQALAHGPTLGYDVWTPWQESVAAQESFRKMQNQLADAPAAGSDARLHVTQGANPNDELSREGLDLILNQYRGNADYVMARARLAREYPDKTDPRGFEDKIGSQLDPRYFQLNRMTPAQRKNYLDAIGDADELRSFITGYERAKKSGHLRFDNGGQ